MHVVVGLEARGPVTERKRRPPSVTCALNALLRGELAAVEVYERALALGRSRFGAHTDDLDECLASHRKRVQFLVAEILQRGGTPIDSSGLLGRLAELLEGVARAMSFKWVTRVLRAGENRGIRIYDKAWLALDNSARGWVTEDLFAHQVLTHQSMFLLAEKLSRVGPAESEPAVLEPELPIPSHPAAETRAP